MTESELEELEYKLKWRCLNDDDIQSLIMEVRHLKKELNTLKDFAEELQAPVNMSSNVNMYIIKPFEDEMVFTIPSYIIREMIRIEHNCKTLTSPNDYMLRPSENSDTYQLDVSPLFKKLFYIEDEYVIIEYHRR